MPPGWQRMECLLLRVPHPRRHPPTPLTVSPAVRDTLEHLPLLFCQTSPCRLQMKVTVRDSSPLTRRRSHERCVPPPPRTPRPLWRRAAPPPRPKLRGRSRSPRRSSRTIPHARCVCRPNARGTSGGAPCPAAPCVVPAAPSAFEAGPLEALARISVSVSGSTQ